MIFDMKQIYTGDPETTLIRLQHIIHNSYSDTQAINHMQLMGYDTTDAEVLATLEGGLLEYLKHMESKLRFQILIDSLNLVFTSSTKRESEPVIDIERANKVKTTFSQYGVTTHAAL